MTRAYGSPKAFLVAMGILVAIGAVAAAAGWWFLERVKGEITARPDALGPALEKRAEPPSPRSGTVPAPSGVRLVVRLRKIQGDRTMVAIGEQSLGVLDDDRTLEAVARQAGATAERAGVAPDTLEGVVEAETGVHQADVLRAVDGLLAAGVKRIVFGEAPK
jgi:hypothetical protein